MTKRKRIPFSGLAPVDIEMLKESGVPDDCIIGDSLDIAKLARLGWRFTDNSLSPPGEVDMGANSVAVREAEKAFKVKWASLFK